MTRMFDSISNIRDQILLEKLTRFIENYEKYGKTEKEDTNEEIEIAKKLLKGETHDARLHFERLSVFLENNPSFEFNDAYSSDVIPEHFCLYPFQNLTLDPDGSVRPCCKFNVGTGKWTDTSIATPELNIQQLYNQKYLEGLRRDFIRGKKPEGCKACWDEEESGIKSMRQTLENGGKKHQNFTLLEHIGSTQPKYLDFKLSSICNLKCRICNSYLSTKWLEEDKNLGTLDIGTFNNHKRNAKEKFILNPKNLETIRQWSSKIENMQFYGGEPLLQIEHDIILTEIINTGNSKKIDLWYNTNATICDEKFFEKWKNFRSVVVNFSIDDVGERAEWERFPSKWNEIENNLSKFKELKEKHSVKMAMSQYLTVSIFNVYYLPEIIKWNQTNHNLDINLNMVHFPGYFSIKILPEKIKNAIKTKLESIDKSANLMIREGNTIDNVISYMYSDESNHDLFEQAVKKIRLHDEYRKQDWTKVFPEFYEIAKEFIRDE